jgi:hypothetical protein
MTGRLVVRSGAGAIEEHAIAGRVTIGSSAPSDVVLDAADLLPLHATVEVRDGQYWIEGAAGGAIAINGHAIDRRALRHLDVVTLGAGVHMIFCAAAAPQRPAQTEKRAAIVPRAAQPGASKTAVGVPVAAFKPRQESPSTRTVGMPIRGPQPTFSPDATPTTRAPAVAPAFSPEETQVLHGPVTGPITSVRLQGPGAAYEAAVGASLIGRGANSTIRIDRPEVSRAHAMLKVSATGVTIEDAGSSRGTAVNGATITGTHPLANGDVVTIGRLDLRVEFIRAGGGS